jgi:predicted metalloprotease
MQIDDERESSYVEDRRGGGGGYGRAGGVGIGGIAVALIASYFLGIDPGTLLGLVETVQNGASQHATQSGARGIDPAADHERGVERTQARVTRWVVAAMLLGTAAISVAARARSAASAAPSCSTTTSARARSSVCSS